MNWLLSKDIQLLINNSEFDKIYIKQSQERENALDVENKLLKQEYEEQKSERLTLDDLKLKPNQYVTLMNTSSEYRQALYDAGEIICLTEVNEGDRKAVLKYRQYLMSLSRSPTNEIPSDKTIVDKINERRTKLFTPRNVENS